MHRPSKTLEGFRNSKIPMRRQVSIHNQKEGNSTLNPNGRPRRQSNTIPISRPPSISLKQNDCRRRVLFSCVSRQIRFEALAGHFRLPLSKPIASHRNVSHHITSIMTKPMRLPPLRVLRVKNPNKQEGNPCLPIMSTVLCEYFVQPACVFPFAATILVSWWFI